MRLGLEKPPEPRPVINFQSPDRIVIIDATLPARITN